MGVIGLTLLVLAVAPAVPPVDVTPHAVPAQVPGVELPPTAKPPVQVPRVELPPTAKPPVQVPRAELPPTAKPPVHVPEVELPPTAKPPTAPPGHGTTPAATPAATTTPAPVAAPTETTTSRRPKATRVVDRRRDRRASAPPAAESVPRRAPSTAVVLADVTAKPTATPAPRTADTRDDTNDNLPRAVIDLVEALPQAVLWSILGIVVIALGLAANAFRLSRQRAALTVQRGELLDDLGLLSRALLPPVPELDGLAVSAAYRPADGPAAGGDFYDVFALDDDRVGILLGDVSGHGRDSVRLAALARFTLRTLLAAGHWPGDALAEADRLLERDLRPHFVTGIAAVYDRRSTRLTYAKAGHAPPIIVGAEHDPNAETPACPIGAGIGSAWPEYHVDLADGVSVCLVTDGFEDARRDGVRLGREQVERLVAAQDRPDAACLLDELGTLADQVCDDTAAVVVARA